jgi:hypothetical protein
MTNVKNDTKILDLKKKIEEKKKELGNGRFSPITNCNLETKDKRYNLHALNEKDLKELFIELHIKNKAVLELELDYKLSGYIIEDWIIDIKSRLAILNRVDEEKKLKIMESKLDKLLSNEKKVELELKEIENMI